MHTDGSIIKWGIAVQNGAFCTFVHVFTLLFAFLCNFYCQVGLLKAQIPNLCSIAQRGVFLSERLSPEPLLKKEALGIGNGVGKQGRGNQPPSLTLQSLLFSISLLFSFSDFPCFFVRFSSLFQGF